MSDDAKLYAALERIVEAHDADRPLTVANAIEAARELLVSIREKEEREEHERNLRDEECPF